MIAIREAWKAGLLGAQALAPKYRLVGHSRRRGVTLGHGVCHRPGRQAGARNLHGNCWWLIGFAFRRESTTDCRPY